MAAMLPFRYGGFWDVPRFILLRYDGKVLYLQSPFDEELDEYPDYYTVYLVPDSMGESCLSVDWKRFDNAPLTRVGQIPISAVKFDSTLRKSLDSSCLEPIFR